ncbi:hypothetical protein D0C16_24220 [Cellvibrio sp. KY-GH-1]|uniref:hypothetical protein n=1 Tax=Cellvibrio sp. KY-GH-1 TaxID=2303332 RepID=UPI00124492FB|nr:hypothetical protein [Cellvibrio sp. KY-GH-1]QEY18811.1 hypothetical protein D0C16_24220 [Cellvibrio sp. KY-GH-1]
MYASKDTQKENINNVVSDQNKVNSIQINNFFDNRPEAIAQRKLVDLINNNRNHNKITAFSNNDRPLTQGSPPIQLEASLEEVKNIGEQILGHSVNELDDTDENNQPPTQNKVIQRLVNPAISLGNPYTFQVEPADIGTGTATTLGTRNYVNGGGAPLFPTASFAYGFFPGGGGWAPGAAPGPLQVAPNPPAPPGVAYDVGHALGRQNGGLGHVNNWVFPQDRNVNRGWAGTFPLWRAHENAFRNGVQALPPGGFGIWHVSLP